MDKKFKVPAECHSDDCCVECNFDAGVWLNKASKKQIVALAKCGWGGDYPADDVAIDMADSSRKIADMFTYISIYNDGHKEHIGFECHVDEEEALAYLSKNRPHIYRDVILALACKDAADAVDLCAIVSKKYGIELTLKQAAKIYKEA